MLSFRWNAPPYYPKLRNMRTYVVVELEPAGKLTRIRLTHLGWGRGERWDKLHAMFDGTWICILGKLAGLSPAAATKPTEKSRGR